MILIPIMIIIVSIVCLDLALQIILILSKDD